MNQYGIQFQSFVLKDSLAMLNRSRCTGRLLARCVRWRDVLWNMSVHVAQYILSPATSSSGCVLPPRKQLSLTKVCVKYRSLVSHAGREHQWKMWSTFDEQGMLFFKQHALSRIKIWKKNLEATIFGPLEMDWPNESYHDCGKRTRYFEIVRT